MKKQRVILLIVSLIPCLTMNLLASNSRSNDYDNRAYWISVMTKIADPVLNNLSRETLHQNMSVEAKNNDRNQVSQLEAFGRTLAGIAPWLELGVDETPEGKLREKYILLTRKCIANAVNPSSPDFMDFTNKNRQPLVDAAFLAQGLLMSYHQLWLPLDDATKTNVVKALQSTRIIKPIESNWLLFSAMIETFLLKTGNQYNPKTIEYALKKHEEWYKGDGAYGDGSTFHWDYYNSFVIQPSIVIISKTLNEKGQDTIISYKTALLRSRRFAAVQERMISPEGTFPPIGRSIVYRFGAFQNLSTIALFHQLPSEVTPAQVRSALSEVIHRVMLAPSTFDKNGWLTIGLYGHQPDLGETYISTGSLYLCLTGLTALGLSANDPFWTSPAEEWTAKKLWKGVNLPADHAIK